MKESERASEREREKKGEKRGRKNILVAIKLRCAQAVRIKNAKFNSFRHVSPENHLNGRKL